MSSGLNVNISLSHNFIAPDAYLDEPLYAVLDIDPVAVASASPVHVPLNIVILVDASATMHHFQLSDEEREYWMGVAISRDEMERGEADEREAVYWTGQTLAEMQSVARTAMSLVVEAVTKQLGTFDHSDHVAVLAFADHVHTVFGADEWTQFPEQCLHQMELLREQRLPVNIGTGTMMADGLLSASAALQRFARGSSVSRLIIISDGIVQDADASLANIAQIQSEGYSITTIGVGDEFDEEFLMSIADHSRGDYLYAADIGEITDCLSQEVATLQHTAVNDLYIALRGLNGAVVQDMFMVRPTLSLFDEVFTEDEWMRAHVGSVSSLSPASVLVQMAPSALAPGNQPIAEAYFTWNTAGDVPGSSAGNKQDVVSLQVASAPGLMQTDPAVTDIVDRFQIYKYEREAQRAQARGDIDRAREKLGAATRELRKIGEGTLASDMEQQIASLGNASADPSRIKRIKATTRRLVSQADVTPISQETL